MSATTENLFVRSAVKARLVQEETFCIMIVGEAGLGKSTLVACLLQVKENGATLEVFDNGEWKEVVELPGGDSTQELRRYRYVMSAEVEGTTVRTFYEIVDTPGFASQINTHNCWLAKLHFLEEGLKRYHERESHDRNDPRVHLCLYVLPPQPRPLKELDKRVMVEVQRCVPVLPIIAKADTFEKETLADFQEQLRAEFVEHGIASLTQLRDFPQHDYQTPLAIISSNKAYRQNDSANVGWEACSVADEGATLGRLYRWGLASCEDPECSDLPRLRSIILNERLFIVEQCDKAYHRWKDMRSAFIEVVAHGLAQLEAWKPDHDKWSSSCCCFPRGPEPKPEDVECTVAKHHELTAEKVWDDEFASSFNQEAQLTEEIHWHARVCDGERPEDARAWLNNIYAASYGKRAGRLASSEEVRKWSKSLHRLLNASLESGALARLVAVLVDALLHATTGMPPGVVRAMASGHPSAHSRTSASASAGEGASR